MEAYKRETEEVMRRFLSRRLDYPDCLAALDAAVANFVLRVTCEQLPPLRVVILANEEILAKEQGRRANRPNVN
jgi:hypothetical protein